MKLKDLKQGMVCELRNGNPFAVSNTNAGRKFYNDRANAFFTLSDDYNDDLTHKRQKDYDIMKVTFGNEIVYKRPESSLFFEPKKDEKYHFVNEGRAWPYVNEANYDDDILRTNIVYKTREEAEKELLRRQAKIRVIKEIARLNQGWDVNVHWGGYDELKYYIIYNYGTRELIAKNVIGHKAVDNNLYLKTKELAEQLIETRSDDLKLMLEVENDK